MMAFVDYRIERHEGQRRRQGHFDAEQCRTEGGKRQALNFWSTLERTGVGVETMYWPPTNFSPPEERQTDT